MFSKYTKRFSKQLIKDLNHEFCKCSYKLVAAAWPPVIKGIKGFKDSAGRVEFTGTADTAEIKDSAAYKGGH